jgi:hypothetical protein
METNMSELKFSDLSITVEDLPVRAQALSAENQADILGGWGFFKKISRGVRSVGRKAVRSVKRTARRGWSYAKKKARQFSKRPVRTALNVKADFHQRLANKFRRMARMSPI